MASGAFCFLEKFRRGFEERIPAVEHPSVGFAKPKRCEMALWRQAASLLSRHAFERGTSDERAKKLVLCQAKLCLEASMHGSYKTNLNGI